MGGLFEEIGDTFFGGAEKDAQRHEEQALGNASRDLGNAVETARGEAKALYGGALSDSQAGFQKALDTWNTILPRQASTYQDGNVLGQQQMLSGLQQAHNALLGGGVDYQSMAPQRVPYNAQLGELGRLASLYDPSQDSRIEGPESYALSNLPPEAHYIRGRVASGELTMEDALDRLTSGRGYGQFTGMPRALAMQFLEAYA